MDRPLHLVRYFAISSLATILVVVMLLGYSYRQITINAVIEVGEDLNVTLGRVALSAVKPELVAYLARVADREEIGPGEDRLPAALADSIGSLLERTEVKRVKIYNRLGLVVYASDPAQIGGHQPDNPGFREAIGGRIASKLVYHDSFNAFDPVTSDDNLIQTYVPVTAGESGSVLGVFAIYTDVNHLVSHAETAEVAMLLVILAVFLALFAVLLAIVWRAKRLIDRQGSMIRDRSQRLETLSAQLLSAQEDEKKRIARALHEDIGQTLGGLKYRVEALRSGMSSGTLTGEALDEVANALQQAIRDIRALAMRLRPLSLDEFGLLETLAGVVRELGNLYPALLVTTGFSLGEHEIPRPLKIVIYRIVQETLTHVARRAEADRAEIRMRSDNGGIELEICENAPPCRDPGVAADTASDVAAWMRERTLLSGGDFSTRADERAGTCFVARWAA